MSLSQEPRGERAKCKTIFIFHSYKVYNLGGERKFLTDLDMSLCLESTAGCLYVVHVLKDSLLPKSECDWNFDYYNSGMCFESTADCLYVVHLLHDSLLP